MRYNLLLLFLISFLFSTAQNKKSGFYKPAPATFVPVNDFADLLTDQQERSLGDKLIRLKDSTGNVVVIITQKNLVEPVTEEPYSVEEVALHYFNKWQIGNVVKNNGVLIFVAKDERKVRIATGKGIDRLLTDNACQSIIDGDIVPNFKEGDYFTGLDQATQSVSELLNLKVDFTTPVTEDDMPAATPAKSSPVNVKGFIFLFLIIGIVLLMIGKKLSARNAGAATSYSRGPSTVVNNNLNVGRRWWGSGSAYGSGNSQPSSNKNNNNSSGKSSGSSGGSSFGGGSSSGSGASGGW